MGGAAKAGSREAAIAGRVARTAAALACVALACVALAIPVPAAAHHPSASAAAAPIACAGAADASLTPHRVITGEFDGSVEGSYVLLPFVVPEGTTAVRVRYCHDQPEAPTNAQIKHVLDLGLYESRSAPGALWGVEEFRGWGGSSHPDVTVSRNGFSSEAQYVANSRLHRQGHTTRGFVPGPVPAGEWAVELGVAAVASQAEGDSDGKVAWRVEVDVSDDPLWESAPYVAAPYDSAPARSEPGWYAGDFHVHAEHSSLGDATMRESFDYAFAPLARDCNGSCQSPGAGLDFVTLSDYVTTSAWGEVGRFQASHPGRLIIRSAEIITYRGHANNHASVSYADYRTAPVFERLADGTLTARRGARPASDLFDSVHGADGFTQINHPTIFPSEVPGFDFICRGCPWDYTDAETDYSKVDAIEVATGPAGLKQDPEPGPNPFTPLAIRFWEDAIDSGGSNANRIAAVGSSDSHNAGRTPDPVTQSPIGQATTVVYANELSERGIQRGVEAGHTYVKVFGNDGPDLRFEGRRLGAGGPAAIMGDTLRVGSAEFTARVIGAGPGATRPGNYELFVLKDGLPFLATPVAGDDFTFSFASAGTGRYRLQLQRDSAIEAVSSPIYVEPAPPPYPRPGGATPLRVPLVPEFESCGTPDAQHVAPLDAPSCIGPRLVSALVTTSSTGKGTAFARLDVAAGDPGTAEDEADVRIAALASDVRERSAGSDYGGELLLGTRLRITDGANGPGEDEPGTAADVDFTIPFACAATLDPSLGATCSLATSADTVMPGLAREGDRAVVSALSVFVADAGPDGVLLAPGAAGCPPACGSGDEGVALRQGVFLP